MAFRIQVAGFEVACDTLDELEAAISYFSSEMNAPGLVYDENPHTDGDEDDRDSLEEQAMKDEVAFAQARARVADGLVRVPGGGARASDPRLEVIGVGPNGAVIKRERAS